MTHPPLLEIAPPDVHQVVGRHLLVDALDFVFDLDKSHGAWLHDSRSGRDLHAVLPDLEDLVRQPCFSGEFREMVANTVSWDEMIEERWAASDL